METKERRIIIYKNQLFYDIDNRTYKFTDAAMQQVDTKAKNAVSSDITNINDHDLLNRYTDNRDSDIRKRLTFCLKDEVILEIDNRPTEEQTYVYDLVLPIDFPDKSLKIAMTKIHEYLVRGSMLDWYIESGVSVSGSPIGSLDVMVADLEDEIVGLLRHPSAVKKPMQPFGPREKIK